MKFDFVKYIYELTNSADKSLVSTFEWKQFWTNHLLFFVFLFFLLGLNITKNHYIEKKIRAISVEYEVLRDMKWNYFTLQSKLLQAGMVGEVELKMKNKGLKVVNEKPHKLIVID